ncbi:MAG: putative response regulator, CheY [Pedosphaera sp.]|nr:putative response regulator, CheY [Pedosphaera sp.]
MIAEISGFMSGAPKENYTVLVVDDSSVQRLVLRNILGTNPKLVVVGEACDGNEAIAYLSGEAQFGDSEIYPFPDLLLLDLEMPEKTGFDVLKWLQTQSFENLMVVVLSGLSLPANIIECTALGADAYHQKSSSKAEQLVMLQKIEALLDASR